MKQSKKIKNQYFRIKTQSDLIENEQSQPKQFRLSNSFHNRTFNSSADNLNYNIKNRKIKTEYLTNDKNNKKSLRFNDFKQLKNNSEIIEPIPQCERMYRSLSRFRKISAIVNKYNKWYITPNNRLRVPLIDKKIGNQQKSINMSKSSNYDVYNKLYDQYKIDSENPFKCQKNQRLQNLDNLSADNVNILEKFKKQLVQNNKRIPKIVNVFIQRKLNMIRK